MQAHVLRMTHEPQILDFRITIEKKGYTPKGHPEDADVECAVS